MNHRKHMIPCLIALVAAMTFFAMAGSNPLAAGLGLAFLLCPIDGDRGVAAHAATDTSAAG